METDPNNSPNNDSGRCIPIAWSPLDAYRVRGNRAPRMPTPCPCGHKECRKNYDEIKEQIEQIIKVLIESSSTKPK